MFHVYEARCADQVWRQAYDDLGNSELTHANGRGRGSRELHHVALSLSDPRQRWVTSRTPPINPVFALAEIIWIIQGRNDAAFLTRWNKGLTKYVGTSPALHGAYGHRLRHHFGFDQLRRVKDVLSREPDLRQLVLTIWDPSTDLPFADGKSRDKDVPCNIGALPKIKNGALEWLQVIRSNDFDLGLPYNIVQWTTVQEIMAGWLELPLGSYNQVSDSLHRYHDGIDKYGRTESAVYPENTDDLRLPYSESVEAFCTLENFTERLVDFHPLSELEDSRVVQLPSAYMNWAYAFAAERLRRTGDSRSARRTASMIENVGLRTVVYNWLNRFEVAVE
jgi:thymidylate synthase